MKRETLWITDDGESLWIYSDNKIYSMIAERDWIVWNVSGAFKRYMKFIGYL